MALPATVLVLTSLLIVVSCNSEKQTKPASKGSAKEIIVVAEDNLWKTSLSDTVIGYFNSDRPALPQPEPLYKVVQINLKEFDNLFESHRNVLSLAIDSSLTQGKFQIGYNVWAQPQRVVQINAPTVELLKSTFIEHQREIFNLFENAEIERLQKLFSKSLNIKASERIKSKFNLDIDIPADYFIAVEKENFVWLRKETNVFSQGLLIYSYPYTDTNAFNSRKIVSIRNQFSSLYVPGPSDSSFMVVADEFISPVSRFLNLKKELAVETRGLWEVRKDFMGGPFINYTLIDKKNNMVLTLDGYVYSPNQDKADLLRQVQAILLTFDFVEK